MHSYSARPALEEECVGRLILAASKPTLAPEGGEGICS